MSLSDADPSHLDLRDIEGAKAPSAAVVVPVKSFNAAKGRLAEVLEPSRRERLARRMASGVLDASGTLPVWVVCDSTIVADWAIAREANVIWRNEPGLNSAVEAAVRYLGDNGFDRVVVAHGDLPLASDVSWIADFDGVTIIPDRRQEGTNVLSVPTNVGFTFSYGDNSAESHWEEASRLNLPARMVMDSALGWDVDLPEDLSVFDPAILQPLAPRHGLKDGSRPGMKGPLDNPVKSSGPRRGKPPRDDNGDSTGGPNRSNKVGT